MTDSPLSAPTARRRFARGSGGDRPFEAVVALAALTVLVVLTAAGVSMFLGGEPAFKAFGLKFFVSTDWDAVNKQFGALIPIYGTLVTAAISLLVGVPASFGIAFTLTETAPRWLRQPLMIAVELLASIPSIIYGMWGLFVFAPFMAAHVEPWLNDHFANTPLLSDLLTGPPIGIGMLTAGMILGVMIIPFISSVMWSVFTAVPAHLKESAVALGATRTEVMFKVILPYTRNAVVGAIFLGLGRALGETMAVTFVLGNAHDFAKSLLMPGNSIAAVIANEFTEADSDLYRSSLIALGFVLFIVTFLVLAAARLLLARLQRIEGAKV
ncbi:MAG: phosphate ABC transporter permease subunit PstC [Alphaproteobacteria bacterium]|nr:phosphate ABC transporter permease subunit PstC [Alphaproteobacteria bacterium]